MMLASASPALATGTMVCEADDKSVEMTAGITLGGSRRGMIVNFGGSIELKFRGAPPGLKKFDLARGDITQSWLDGKGFKLELYREWEEKPGAYVLVVVDTKRVEEGKYTGRYRIESDIVGEDGAYGPKPKVATGKATCESD